MRTKILSLFIACFVLSLTGCGSTASPSEGAKETPLAPESETGAAPAAEASAEQPFELHMTNAFDSDFELDYKNCYIMTAENTDVRGIPREYGAVNRTLSYQMVDVYAATYADDGKWVLIGFFCFDSAHDNMGWVKVSDLMEYNEENYLLLTYPVQVTEDCIDLNTGEPVQRDAFEVHYIEDYAEILREGGRSYRVSPDDIIYPGFVKE